MGGLAGGWCKKGKVRQKVGQEGVNKENRGEWLCFLGNGADLQHGMRKNKRVN